MAPKDPSKTTLEERPLSDALAARVPVLLSFIDASRKECGLGPLVHLTGDVERDLDTIRAFYADKRGIYPELAGEIRFKGGEHIANTADE